MTTKFSGNPESAMPLVEYLLALNHRGEVSNNPQSNQNTNTIVKNTILGSTIHSVHQQLECTTLLRIYSLYNSRVIY